MARRLSKLRVIRCRNSSPRRRGEDPVDDDDNDKSLILPLERPIGCASIMGATASASRRRDASENDVIVRSGKVETNDTDSICIVLRREFISHVDMSNDMNLENSRFIMQQGFCTLAMIDVATLPTTEYYIHRRINLYVPSFACLFKLYCTSEIQYGTYDTHGVKLLS